MICLRTTCRAEVVESDAICPEYGDDITARQERADKVEKLIAASCHAEPATPVRAAWIQGEHRERTAVESPRTTYPRLAGRVHHGKRGLARGRQARKVHLGNGACPCL